MHLLLIAPSAPPKNSPEAIQVKRFLDVLDPAVKVTLVTTPVTAGWVRHDAGLEIKRPGLRTITLALPFHRLSQRVVGSHRLARWHAPDSDFWLISLARRLVGQLGTLPDVIYSRSAPFAAALLARQVKQEIRRPWLMHLSDPWAGSPYRAMHQRRFDKDLALEASCFADADAATLTTEGQAAFYRLRYPKLAHAIGVTPNMQALVEGPPLGRSPCATSRLRVIHTGALYGDRDPSGLVEAVHRLRARIGPLTELLSLDFYGNIPETSGNLLSRLPEVSLNGPVPYNRALRLQSEADILLSIEPYPTHELHPHFLLSKVVDYLASGRPILALASRQGTTAHYCNRGYGWVLEPTDVEGIAAFLEKELETSNARSRHVPQPPIELSARSVTTSIEIMLASLACCRGQLG